MKGNLIDRMALDSLNVDMSNVKKKIEESSSSKEIAQFRGRRLDNHKLYLRGNQCD